MKEAFVYLAIAISSLIMIGYAVHMLVGGLVNLETEYLLISITCAVVSGVIGYMARDVIHRRSSRK